MSSLALSYAARSFIIRWTSAGVGNTGTAPLLARSLELIRTRYRRGTLRGAVSLTHSIAPAALAAARRKLIVSWMRDPAREPAAPASPPQRRRNALQVAVGVGVVAFAVIAMDRARRFKGLAINFDHAFEGADQRNDARPLLRIVKDRDAGIERIPGIS